MNWECVIQTIVAIGFGIATLVLAITRVKRKKPVWGYDVRKIIGVGSKAPPEVKLSFNDEEIRNVFRTVVIFFNKGNEVIHKKDVVKRISVDFGDGKILRGPMLLSISKEENNFSVNKVADNSVELGFNYLGRKDGACIEVMHSGGSRPSMSGTIIDTPILEIGGFAEDMGYPGIVRTILSGIAAVALGVFFVVELHSVFSTLGEPLIASRVFIMSLAGAIAAILGVILRDDVPLLIRAMRFPSWGRHISRKIAGAKLSVMGPIFAFCPACGHEVEITGVTPIKMRNGVIALSGSCAECGAMIYRVGAEGGGN